MEKNDTPTEFQQTLEEIVREGARKMLQQAVENEIEEFIKPFNGSRDEQGRRVVKRNGYLPEREIQTGIGPLNIKKPRARGRELTSAILPK